MTNKEKLKVINKALRVYTRKWACKPELNLTNAIGLCYLFSELEVTIYDFDDITCQSPIGTPRLMFWWDNNSHYSGWKIRRKVLHEAKKRILERIKE